MDNECGLPGGGYMVEGGIDWNQSYCTQIMLCAKYNTARVYGMSPNLCVSVCVCAPWPHVCVCVGEGA